MNGAGRAENQANDDRRAHEKAESHKVRASSTKMISYPDQQRTTETILRFVSGSRVRLRGSHQPIEYESAFPQDFRDDLNQYASQKKAHGRRHPAGLDKPIKCRIVGDKDRRYSDPISDEPRSNCSGARLIPVQSPPFIGDLLVPEHFPSPRHEVRILSERRRVVNHRAWLAAKASGTCGCEGGHCRGQELCLLRRGTEDQYPRSDDAGDEEQQQRKTVRTSPRPWSCPLDPFRVRGQVPFPTVDRQVKVNQPFPISLPRCDLPDHLNQRAHPEKHKGNSCPNLGCGELLKSRAAGDHKRRCADSVDDEPSPHRSRGGLILLVQDVTPFEKLLFPFLGLLSHAGGDCICSLIPPSIKMPGRNSGRSGGVGDSLPC